MKKQLSEEEARAMTVNERLYAFGLIDDFDDAVVRRDVPELKSILQSVYLQPENIQAVIKQVLGAYNGAA